MREKWTSEKVPRQDGLVAAITGANTGLGFELQCGTNQLGHFALTGLDRQEV